MYIDEARQPPNPALLFSIEVISRISDTVGGARLDLNGDTLSVDRGKQIQLTALEPDVALVDGGATPDQEIGSDALTEATQLPRAQRAEVGSSSSMFTSRNVMTFTLLTNLAGRYMSHTHASFNSNSK